MRKFTQFGVVAAMAIFAGQAFAAADVDYTLSPKANSVVNEITSITLSFPNGEMVGYYDVRPAVASLENLSSGEIWYCVNPLINRPDEDGVRSITFEFSNLGDSTPEDITAEGEYLLSIKGLYTSTIDDEGNESEPEDLNLITANYTIVYPYDYTLNPANGETLENLSSISLTFPEGSNVGYYDVHPAVGTLENLTTGNVWYCITPSMSFNDEGEKVFTFEFSEIGEEEPVAINEAGEYKFSVRGLYTSSIDDEGEESEPVDLPVIVASYTVVYPVAYTLNPESGSNLDVIDAITLTVPAGVGFYGDTTPGVVVLENIATGDVWYCTDPADNGFDGEGNRTYVFEFSEFGSEEVVTIKEAGNYRLSIRGLYTSFIGDDGDESEPVDLPVITATYTVVYPVQYYFTPSDGSEVESISSILLTFIDNPMIGIYEEMRPAVVVLENLTTGNSWYCENPIKERLDDGSSEFTIEFSELGSSEVITVTEEGEYLLTVKGIYESVLEDDVQTDVDLPNIEARFIVSENAAVHSIFNDNSYNVFGINGMSVMRNGRAEDLKNLQPGLYIINGKKVLIRK